MMIKFYNQFLKIVRLYLIFEKFVGKCKGKKIEEKNRMKEK